MAASTTQAIPHLVVRARDRAFALPADAVVETMRPLPQEPLAGAPAGVTGVAVVRGEVVPVVALARLLDDDAADDGGGETRRWVLVRAGARRVALAVAEVAGLRAFDPAAEGLAPLLREAQGEAIAAIVRLDDGLLRVLDATRLLPAGLDLPGGPGARADGADAAGAGGAPP